MRLYRQARVSVSPKRHALLIKPLTFMNRSGDIAHYFIPRRYSVEDLIVICDNLDLPAGTIRVRRGGSSAGHNGLKSLIEHLGSSDFTRIYVGIGRPKTGVTVVEHVLSVPGDADEKERLAQGVSLAAEATLRLCKGETAQEVAHDYNKRIGRS